MLNRRRREADPQLLVDITKSQLEQHLGFIDAVDAKLGLLLSVGSALLGILAAVLALRPHPLTPPTIAILALTGLAYLILAALSGKALWDRPWGLGPEPREVEKDIVYGVDETDIKWGLAARYNGDYEANENAGHGKLIALRVSVIAVIAESLLLAAVLTLLAYQV